MDACRNEEEVGHGDGDGDDDGDDDDDDDEAKKWKTTFSGHEVCWTMDRMAAIDPLMYAISKVIAM